MLCENGAWFPDAKRDGFLPYMSVPSEVSSRFQIVVNLGNDVDEKRLIESSGFEVLSPDAVASLPSDFRTLIQNSLGEFSAAKPSYVKLKTSWISDRTVCYLASGKPCVIEDTGQSATLGYFDKGLHRFRNREGAVRSINKVMEDYDAESRAARAIAEELFDASKICERVLSIAIG